MKAMIALVCLLYLSFAPPSVPYNLKIHIFEGPFSTFRAVSVLTQAEMKTLLTFSIWTSGIFAEAL